jgi:hypothetical protein
MLSPAALREPTSIAQVLIPPGDSSKTYKHVYKIVDKSCQLCILGDMKKSLLPGFCSSRGFAFPRPVYAKIAFAEVFLLNQYRHGAQHNQKGYSWVASRFLLSSFRFILGASWVPSRFQNPNKSGRKQRIPRLEETSTRLEARYAPGHEPIMAQEVLHPAIAVYRTSRFHVPSAGGNRDNGCG